MTNRYLTFLRGYSAGDCGKRIEQNLQGHTLIPLNPHNPLATHTGEISQSSTEFQSLDRGKSVKSEISHQAIEIAPGTAAEKPNQNCGKRACCVCHQTLSDPPTAWWGDAPCHYDCGLAAWREAYQERSKR
jgi:hypothetical protein